MTEAQEYPPGIDGGSIPFLRSWSTSPSDHGSHDLKGFEEPARLFQVGWADSQESADAK